MNLSAQQKKYTENNEFGGISIKSILGLLVVIIGVYAAIAFLPVVHTPADLEGVVKARCDQWLRLPAREATPATLRVLDRDLKDLVAEKLASHEYDEKDLKISYPNRRTIKVILPYTVVVKLFGSVFTYDKQLDVEQTSYTF